MQKVFDEFEKRDTVVVAISQEDKDLKSASKFLKAFKGKNPPFDIVADLDREKTKRFDRTTSYLIDKNGKIREIFPAMVHMRPDWRAVLNRIDEMVTPKAMTEQK